MESVTQGPATNQAIQPIDIIAGLGSADRQLLAVSLALFDDSTLFERINELVGKASHWVECKRSDGEIKEMAKSVETRMVFWRDSDLTDDDLRLTLWIYVRDALCLPPRLTRSSRGAATLADELTAAAVHVADPPGAGRAIKEQLAKWGWCEGDQRYTTLDDVVQPVLQELTAAALTEGTGQMDAAARKKLITEIRTRLRSLDEAEKQRMLEAVGAQELNDAAVRKILLTGGGLGAFSTGVSIAGFSAYILAAEASAFIPLVSGPALVSTVAVLSNPVTVLAATGAALWWFTTSANNQVRTAVALRVLALLALQGLGAGRAGVERTLASFARMEELPRKGKVASKVFDGYASDWELLITQTKARANAVEVEPRITDWMRRPVASGETGDRRWRRLIFPAPGEGSTTAAVGILTLGDITYSAAAIDPVVIQAADFARVESIGNRLAFAEFAQKIEELDPVGTAGAISNVKGYVAERVVAAELVANGHQVEFPADANQPGWDLQVDGNPFQVKCLADGSGLSEHFSKYPDVPVLANAELVDQVPDEWVEKVFFVEDYSNELVTEVTENSLDAGADMLEPDVPVFVLAVVTMRQLMAYKAGKVSGVQAVEQSVLDGGIRAGLAAAGGFLGEGIGLLVFGPAGALVLGTIIPVLSQVQAGRVREVMDHYVKPESYQQWEAKVHRALDELRKVLTVGIDEKLDILRNKYRATARDGVGAYVRARLLDEALYLDEYRIRIDQLEHNETQSVEKRALALIQWTAGSTVHPVRYQTEMQQLQAILLERPTLAERTEEVFDRTAKTVKEFVRDHLGAAEEFLDDMRDVTRSGKEDK